MAKTAGGDVFEKSVELPDTSEKIYYKVGAAVTCHLSQSPAAFRFLGPRDMMCPAPPPPPPRVAMCDTHQRPLTSDSDSAVAHPMRYLPGVTLPDRCHPTKAIETRLQKNKRIWGGGREAWCKWPFTQTITAIKAPN